MVLETRLQNQGAVQAQLTAERLEECILSQLPANVQNQLPPEEWNNVISAAVRSLNSCSAKSSRASDMGSQVDDFQATHDPACEGMDDFRVLEDGNSVISGLTDNLSGFTPDNVIMVSKPVRIDLVEETKSSSSHGTPLLSSGKEKVISSSKSRKLQGNSSQVKSDDLVKHGSVRSVEFGKVLVREYQRVLEVNPSTSSGPSVGIGWGYAEEAPVTLDAHQAARRYCKRNDRCPVLRRETREMMLTKLGYTRREMAKSVRECLKIKNQRKQTYTNMHHEKIEYMVEKSKRKVGRLLRPLKMF